MPSQHMPSSWLLALLLVAWASTFALAEIITLDDASFEHDTQASTGQTTGRWLVLAIAKANKELDKELDIAWEDAGRTSRQGPSTLEK